MTVYDKTAHKYCKRRVKRLLLRLSVIASNLQDMNRDACPALCNLKDEDIAMVQLAIDTLRRKI